MSYKPLSRHCFASSPVPQAQEDNLPHITFPACMSSSPDLSILACGCSDAQIYLFTRDTLQPIRSFSSRAGDPSHHENLNAGCLFSKSNPNLILTYTGQDKIVLVHDLRTNSIASSFSHPGPITSLDINSSDTHLVTGSQDMVTIWDLRSSKKFLSTDENHSEEITCVSFNPVHESIVLSGSEDGLVCVSDIAQGGLEDGLISILNCEAAIDSAIFFGPSGENVVVVTLNETLSIWNVGGDDDSGSKLLQLNAPRSLILQPEDRVQASLFAQSTIPPSLLLPQDQPQENSITTLVKTFYNEASNHVCLVSSDDAGTAFVSSIETDGLHPLFSLPGVHTACIRSFDFSAKDSGSIFTGAEDGVLSKWMFS
ncbi:putative Replication factor C subunit 2 [Blattamonas nauphoetae]|uniref:Replication factor C subunit 2 n=1 Tax=Blattamonas nauphoetae TaxID=2049346 RepID=A0ABQ9XE20_9EUKA|nr:putative Replication factor C subunit 2 [Blattamonas nauphoetae]